MSLLLTAKRFAFRHHAGQHRPNATNEPVVVHLAEVSAYVADEGWPEHVVAAAWLHDVVEDTEVSHDDVRDACGEVVAGIVAGLTDPPGFADLPLPERKRLQTERLAGLPRDVAIVKLADQVSNMRSVVDDPPVDWGAAACLAYLEGAAAVARACYGVSARLDALVLHHWAQGEAGYGADEAQRFPMTWPTRGS